MKFVAYYRVSTQRQGVSGLGLEAQQEAVKSFAGSQGEIIASFTEVESGKRNDRPQLRQAIALTNRTKGATLLIAKLDRLARNVQFIAALMDNKTKFIAVDIPGANDAMIQMMAIFAEHEGKAISKRVKEALERAKARGTKLGSDVFPDARANGIKGGEVVHKRTKRRWSSVKSMIDESREMTLKAAAEWLNDEEVKVPGRPHAEWTYSLVYQARFHLDNKRAHSVMQKRKRKATS